MIVKLFLGTSGSGKTTYIEKNVLKDRILNDGMFNGLKISMTNDIILFGHYNCDRRCKGCDTLSMTAINDIIKSLEELLRKNQFGVSQIILDGDRVNNKKMLDFLLPYKELVEIYWIDTDLATIYERLPECNKVFVKTTETKTRNMIMQYYAKGFKVIKVETKKKGGLL